MKELNESTVEMLRSDLDRVTDELDELEEYIRYLESKIKSNQEEFDEQIEKRNRLREVYRDICELIGYEEA